MFKADLVQWQHPDSGPVPCGPPIKVVKVRPNNPVNGFFLSDFVLRVSTHWFMGRTKPCIGLKNGCEYCATGMTIRPKGYIAVALGVSVDVWLLEVSDGAFESNPDLLNASGMRGWCFRAKRTGANINSRLEIATFPGRYSLTPLPPDVDIKAVLNRIWFGKMRPNTFNGG